MFDKEKIKKLQLKSSMVNIAASYLSMTLYLQSKNKKLLQKKN